MGGAILFLVIVDLATLLAKVFDKYLPKGGEEYPSPKNRIFKKLANQASFFISALSKLLPQKGQPRVRK